MNSTTRSFDEVFRALSQTRIEIKLVYLQKARQLSAKHFLRSDWQNWLSQLAVEGRCYLQQFITSMKITDVLRAEHAVFHNLFDHIEAVVPRLKSLSEVKTLAAVIEKVHAPHSKTEDDLFIEPLEPYFDQMGQRDTFHAEHEHIESTLIGVQKARTLKVAKKTLLNAIAASRKHFDKEERVVFPLAERVLKAKTLSELGEEWLHRRDVGRPPRRL